MLPKSDNDEEEMAGSARRWRDERLLDTTTNKRPMAEGDAMAAGGNTNKHVKPEDDTAVANGEMGSFIFTDLPKMTNGAKPEAAGSWEEVGSRSTTYTAKPVGSPKTNGATLFSLNLTRRCSYL